MAYIGKFIDRSPAIIPAGEIFPPKENVCKLLKYYPEEDQIAALKREAGIIDCRFNGKLQPYGNTRNLGLLTEIRPIISPQEPSKFKQFEHAIREAIYDSNKNYTLGKQRFPFSKPEHISILTNFGKPSTVDAPLYEIILPKDYKPELIQPKKQLYNECFNPRETMGKYCAADKRGMGVKNAFQNHSSSSNIIQISRIQGDVIDRSQPILGKVLEPCKNKEKYPCDFTYGKKADIYKYGVRELMKKCEPCDLKLMLYKSMAYVNKVRILLKKRDVYFPDIIVYIKEQDKNKCGALHKDFLISLFGAIGILLDYDQMEFLLKYLNIADETDCINYIDFIKLLDKNNEIPPLGKIKDVPDEDLNFDTTYSAFANQMFEKISERPNAGLPSCRNDLQFPRVPEFKAYREMLSDETKMVAVVEPNIGTIYGLSHRDYLLLRPKQEIFLLFKKAGYDMSNAEEVWEECLKCECDKDNLISIDTFRAFYNKMHQSTIRNDFM